jgi:hypothetical protein
MPAKMARSAPRPPFGLPKVTTAVLTSRLSCRKAGKPRIFKPVRESSGESRFKRVDVHGGIQNGDSTREVASNAGTLQEKHRTAKAVSLDVRGYRILRRPPLVQTTANYGTLEPVIVTIC